VVGPSSVEGETVEVRRVDSAGETLVGTATLDATGAFSLEDVPDRRGFSRYVVRWAGDDSYDSVVDSASVEVYALDSSLRLTLDQARYTAGETAHVTVTLGHEDTSPGSVRVILRDVTQRTKIAEGQFDANGKFRVSTQVLRKGIFVARYRGDATHSKARVSLRFGVRPVVASTVDRSYRTDGTTWFVRPRVDPIVTWTATPSPIGTCGRFTLERRTDVGWRPIRESACEDLSGDSRYTVTLSDPRRVGTRWRVRLEADATKTHTRLKSDWTYIGFERPTS